MTLPRFNIPSKWLFVRVSALVVFVGLTLSLASAADPSYMELLSQAIDSMDHGQYNAAAETLDQALALQPGEITARLALAITLAHTRKVDSAIEEYRFVLSAEPANGLAAHGLGVCYLSQGNLAKSREMFLKSGKVEASAAAIGYIDYLQGLAAPGGLSDPASQFVRAASLRRANKAEEAQPFFVEIASRASATGYQEECGAVMTLDASQPVIFTAEPIAKLPKMRISAGKNLPKISGEISVRPGPDIAGTDCITVKVDGTLAGIMNCRPYQFVWDTTRYSNGIHTVTMFTESNDGSIISDKPRNYWVQNGKPGKGFRLPESDEAKLIGCLWRQVAIKPSVKLGSYYAASYCASAVSLAAAAPLLEKAAACDPDFADVRALLQKCYGRKGYTHVSSGPPGSKTVALTFDDGPNSNTKKILETLDREGVKATFFMVGSQIALNPSIVRAMADDGQEIESHTFSHRNLDQLTEREVEIELLRCAAAVRDASGRQSVFFRPPGGHVTPAAEAAAAKYGFTGVFWTLLCSTFEARSPEKMAEYVRSSMHDGAIVLMHNGDRVTMEALPVIISDLRAKGYVFVTLSELIGR